MPFGNVLAVDVEIAFTGVPVSRLAAGRDFFERVLGRAADVEVAANEVMWCLSERAWLYVVADPGRAGHGLVSLSVADLDAALGELASRDVVPVRTEVVGDAGRKATLLDPDGNSVALLEVRS